MKKPRLFLLILALALVALPYQAGAQTTLTVSQVPTAPFVIPGGTVTYVITVTNTGFVAATDVSVRTALSASLALLLAQPQAQVVTNPAGQQVVVFEIGTLAPGAAFTATIDAKASPTLSASTVLSSAAVSATDNVIDTEVTEVVVIVPKTAAKKVVAVSGGDKTAGAATQLPKTGIDPLATAVLALLATSGAILLIPKWKKLAKAA